MPVSPYYGQSGYVNRSYARSSSSSNIPLLDYVYGGSKYSSADNRGTATERENNFASYFRSKYTIPEDGPASSYLVPRYTPGAQSGYQLKRYSSTDNVPDIKSSVEDSKLKKSPSTSSFLTGNTTSFMKNFNTPETTSSNALSTASRPKNFDYNLPTAREEKKMNQKEPVVRKFVGKSGGQSSYVNQYLARINKERDVRPREIDTRDINTSEKPRTAKWLKPDPNNEEEGLISRNRQVVRLTIKREKDEPNDPFVIKNKTLQTIAQRLMDKYRLPEKKPEPSVKEPTRSLHQDADPPKDKPPVPASAARPPIPSSSTVSRTAASVAPQDPLTSQTSSKDSPEGSGAIKSAPSSCEEEKSDDAARRLLRATTVAESKRELESWEEVRDAIYAAVLSPDVDLESDEEMEKLVKGDADAPDGSGQGKDGSEGTGEGKGRAIVGQLKRFVKQQESVKGPSKKRSSAKNSRKSKKSRKGQDQTGAQDVVNKILISETRNEKEKASLLTPDLVTDDAKNDKNKDVKEKTLKPDTCYASKDSSKGLKDVNDPVKTESGEKQESVQGTMVKLSRFTALSDRLTKTDGCSLLSAGLVLNNATPQDETQIKSKTSTAHQTKPENRISEVEKVGPKPVNDEKEQSKDSSKDMKKDKSSLLSSDLVFNVVTSDDKKKTQVKALPPTGQKKAENRKSELEESNRKSIRDVKEQVKEKLCTKPEKKVESSLLSADLVLTSVTSEEKKTTPTKQEPEHRVSELKGNSSKPPNDEKEQTKVKLSTKIPKLKKKKKQVEETSPEVLLPSVSPVSPPSDSVFQGQSVSEEVSKSQALPPLDVSTELNKESSNRTSATGNAIKTSYHQQHSTTPVQPKLSVSRKEDECVGNEESSAGGVKGRVTTRKPTTDVSIQLATSKIPAAPSLTQSSKDEKAVEVESSKDTKDANKDLKETYPVFTISKCDDKEKLKDDGTQSSKDEKAVEVESSKDTKDADKDLKETYPVFTISKCDDKEKLKDDGTQSSKDEKAVEVESSKDTKDADKDLKETYPVFTISKCDDKEKLKDDGTQNSKDEKAVEVKSSKDTKDADKDLKETYPVFTISKCDDKEKLKDDGTQSSKDEKAVEVESSKDTKDADKDLKETYPVFTISKCDDKEKLKDDGTQSSKDEKAVEVESSKDTKDADKDLKETYPVFTIYKCDEIGKLKDEGTQKQSIEKLQETKEEGEKENTLFNDKSKPPEETHVTKAEEKKMVDATAKPSGIPRKRIEAVNPTQEKKLIGLEEIQKEVEDKERHEEKPEKTTEKIEEGKEKRENIRQESHEETLNENEVLKDTQTSPDALPAKKPFKRLRQIVPPPEPQKTIGNELLNARNILKRPIKQIPVVPTNNKQEQTITTVAATKKIWKRPAAPLVPPNQGDLFLQARSALKKPLKPKEDEKIEKRDEIAEPKPKDDVKIEKKEEKVPETRFKKFVKKPVASSQPNEVGETEQGTRGRALKKQRHTRSRSASSSSSSSYDGSTVRKKVEKPKRLMKPKPTGAEKTPSPKVSSPGSPKLSPVSPKLSSVSPKLSSVTPKLFPVSPKLSPVPSKLQEPEEPSPPVEKTPADSGRDQMASSTKETTGSIGQDPKLSACQSADSGYGSSPSTPQPTPTVADVKDEEVCTVCGTNCHKKCEKQMPNLCGVNQKLLAEALSSVKKGGSADGTTRTLASPTKASSSVSGSETETTEDETESTDTDSDFFGPPEIRAPIQTCLKFKKYTVDDFNFIKVLGKGSYGKVMLAQQKDSENYFAVKCLKKDVVLEDNDIECTLIERKVLSLGTKHPYLCHLFCTFQTPSHLFFVMEYLTGGDLMFHIQHCGRFDEFRACFYAAEITSGLKFLHSKGIIYRDLKLDNILLDYQGHIRIADFGMCKLQVYLDRYADTFCGTPDYMAPEVIKGLHYNQCVDWWSFGVLLYEMLTGKSPFKGCDEDHLFWLICNDEPFFPKFLSKEATHILKQLLDKDSTRRLGIPFSPYGEITVHPFFKYIDWHKIERKEVETPYKPRLRHILDVQYFDPLFTKRHAAITPLDESILTTMDQTAFRDFSYTNPNITD